MRRSALRDGRRRFLALGTGAGLGLLLGCGGGDSGSPNGPTASPTPSPPIGDGPWNHDLKMAWSGDGATFDSPSLFLKAGGVPSLARLADGRLLSAFQWFPDRSSPSWDRVATRQSLDGGGSWSDPQPVSIAGLPSSYQRPFDPTLVALPDGRVRIYFTSNPDGNPTGGDQNGFYSAIGSDGVNFTWEAGTRFWPGKSVVDCAALYWGGVFHLTAPAGSPTGGAYHAVAADGLTFTRLEDIASSEQENWTGNLLAVGSLLRFYGTANVKGMWFRESADGSAWTQPRYLGLNGGDPAVVQTLDGRFLAVFVS